MTDLLIHKLPQLAEELGRRLTTVLNESETPDVRKMAAGLNPDETQRFVIATTGQYSAGKSALLRALTGDSTIVSGADVTTSSVTSYAWGEQVLLVDTPGVQAGLVEHDVLAEQALREADLVMFVVTVDLFDDLSARHLRHVAKTLGKQRAMIIIINKAGTLAAHPDVRRRAVIQALGSDVDIPPIVICDALDYLDGAAASDDELVAESGFALLPAAINTLVRASGVHGRLRRPFDHMRSVIADAHEALAGTEAERTAWSLLNRERRALLGTKDRIDNAVRLQSGRLRSTFRNLADEFSDVLDAAEDDGKPITDLSELQHALEQSLGSAADACLESLEAEILAQLARAGDELRAIGESPQAAWLRSQSPTSVDAPSASSGGPASPLKTVSEIASEIGSWANKFADFWAGDARKISDVSGSLGHRVVTEIGHWLGVKFKPWQAARWAKHIHLGARIAGHVGTAVQLIKPLMDHYAAAEREGRRNRRRGALQAAVTRTADDLFAEVAHELAEQVYPVLNEGLDELRRAEEELRNAQQVRSTTQGALDQINVACTEAIGLLASGAQIVATN